MEDEGMKGKKLLVVEDEADLREAIKFDLEMSGYEVYSAEDGIKGLKLAREKKPDLLILDLLLPRMDGYRVCRMLKVDEETGKLPIIMLTAKAGKQDEKLGLESGADLYMTKPFEPEKLLENVKLLIQRTLKERKN
ncbi:MAG: response regulator [Candidatus Glassbacteria bacterium]